MPGKYIQGLQLEGAPLSPHLDTESSEQKQTLGNWSGFSLKREIKHPFFTLQVFLHTELHISCNTSSSHGTLMTKLTEQHRNSYSQHSLPARLSAPDIPCSGSSHQRSRQRWSPSTAISGKSSLSLTLFFFFCFVLLSFILLPCIRTQLSQISLYLRQIMSESLPKYINGS